MKIKVSECELLDAGYRRAYTPASNGISEPVTPGTSSLAKLERGTRVKPKRFRTYRQGMTEAGLLAALQNNGIGRPATYALIIETLIQRKYAESVGGNLVITPRGKVVLEFLVSRYPQLFSVEFTAKMEDMLDEIAEGRKTYRHVIGFLWEEVSS